MVTEIASIECFTANIKLIYRDIKNITNEYLSNFFQRKMKKLMKYRKLKE